MDKIRINLTLESVSDAELYQYLIKTAPRRRATLLRALAMQGLHGVTYLKSGLINENAENKTEIKNEFMLQNDSTIINDTPIKDKEIIIEAAKSKSMGIALGDMKY